MAKVRETIITSAKLTVFNSRAEIFTSVAPSLDAETQGDGQELGRLVPAQFVILRVVILHCISGKPQLG